ncbi:MAG: xanthine dehydrogenase accessory protein XdhC, partial [Rhodobacteraceae bacterium]|nr:xanthine dehydrogenase accessory protein XdhC [Paracoccaceae bacterium]
LEFMAISRARAMLESGEARGALDIPLGPEIGQCCGGRVEILLRRVDARIAETLRDAEAEQIREQPAVFIFGAGHVGRALLRALEPLPLTVTLVESRQAEGKAIAGLARVRLEAMPESVVEVMPKGAAAVIVTHDHALDFLIARAALMRSDLAYVGMIGSQTKRAAFANWLKREGDAPARAGGSDTGNLLSRLVLPIGGARVRDKRPEVIAALTVAEILAALAHHRALEPARGEA